MVINKEEVICNRHQVNLYSLRFKVRVMFAHKVHYKLKVMFGEIFLKLRQQTGMLPESM
jgi:hypothetical protein